MKFTESFKNNFLKQKGYSLVYRKKEIPFPTYHNDVEWKTVTQLMAIKDEKEFDRDEIFKIELDKEILKSWL